MSKKLITLLVVALLLAGGVFVITQKKRSQVSVEPVAGTNTEHQETQDAGGLEPSKDYTIRPDFSKVKNFTQTLALQKGVSVKYGDGWVGKKTGDDEFVSGGLFKTVNGRSYAIAFQENNSEYLSAVNGAYANNLKVYEEVLINNKPHFVITSSLSSKDSTGENVYDYAYFSACPIKTNEACSLPVKQGLIFIQLRQDVPGAQYPVELDFSRSDDQQILAEFAEIMSTLKY